MRCLTILLLMLLPTGLHAANQKVIFGGGCFWCMEPPFEKLEGVIDVVSGYSGGTESNPSYEQVSSGQTEHVEVIEITFDDKALKFDDLLTVFWQQIDPTDSDGQFVDRGLHYRTVIYTTSQAQLTRALESRDLLIQSEIFDGPIVTEIRMAGAFHRAESYHQDYYKTNPFKYKFYRLRSGRDQFLDSVWDKQQDFDLFEATGVSEGPYVKPTYAKIKAKLSDIQYKVTQEDGTEPPFNNAYWNTKEAGIYVDIVSGEPLFSSLHKYDSGTGWPSFWKPLEAAHISERDDRKLWMLRTEVRSKFGDSHLGHIFDDGPAPTGLRYCINSASLEFIPVEKLEERGYGYYSDDFSQM